MNFVSVEQSNPSSGAGGKFAPTHWTVVLAARDATPGAQTALEKLCQTYWPPIYAFVRRQGKSSHDAQDLTQEFFARLLERNSLADVDRSKGKFRSFLLASLKNFLANEWNRAHAQKRGGHNSFISIDANTVESSCCVDPPDHATAEKAFDRRWAMTLLDKTLARLRDEYRSDSKAVLFESLKETLTGERTSLPYSDLAQRLGTSEGNIKVAVHRLRQRYRELLRAEIAETVGSDDQVEDELRSLFAALS